MKIQFIKTIFILSIVLFLVCIVNAGQVPQISEEEKSLAITSIEEYRGVQEAAIAQEGIRVNLAIIVNYATSKAYAKQLGDNFVRLVKTFSKDKAPGKEIGKGIYNYLVGVYYPNKKQIVLGAKVSGARSITW